MSILHARDDDHGRDDSSGARVSTTSTLDAPRPTFDPPAHPSTTTAPPVFAPHSVRWMVLAVAALAGLVAATSGPFGDAPAPTGSAAIDFVLVALAVGGVTWLGAAALRWDMAIVSIVAGITSWSIVGAVVGVINAAVGYAIPDRRGLKSVITAGMVGVTLNVLCHSQLGAPGHVGFFGLSSIVGVGLGAVVAVLGLRRRTPATRRFATIGALVVAPLALIGTVGLLYGAYASRTDLREANRQAEQALDQLGDGQITEAQASFTAAAAAFRRADSNLSNPAAQLARFVPVVAQHRNAAADLSHHAADASGAIAEQLAFVDLDSLTIVDGRIDLDKVRALQAPLLAIKTRIEGLDAAIADVRSPWLIRPATDRIDTLADDVARQQQRSDDALSVAIAAPALLGADGPRVYFIAFTTPAEARGLGGFMGNWAEMTIDNGLIQMTRFGRADDLDAAAAPGTRFLTGPADWLTRYGPFQLTSGENGSTDAEPWKNVTMSPSMEYTGQAIAELYPQSGGQALDGVFAMDVYTLARFLNFTGPITLPDGSGPVDGGPVTADNAAKFLLNDQYDVTELDNRVDVLSDFSHAVVDALLTGSLPPPTDLLDVLGPMVDQGRFSAYAVRGNEEDLLRQIGLGGTLPIIDTGITNDTMDGTTGDALAIAFNNAVGNKIDYYLASAATYTVTADQATNTASATLELTMTNGAPVDGEPNYVIGNPIDLPIGENRTYVSVFTRLPVQAMLIDGKHIDAEPGSEAGYFTTSAFVQIAAGQTATLTFTMSGPLDLTDGYALDARTPPTVAPTPIDVDVTFVPTDGGAATHTVGSQHDPGTLHLAAS